jgi:hypothetical protein
MSRQSERSRDIARHVFSGATTMVGVCITIITLFRVLGSGSKTYADEILGIDNFIFIAAAIFSYVAIRKENNQKMEHIADILFFTGMCIMLIVGLLIVYSSY